MHQQLVQLKMPITIEQWPLRQADKPFLIVIAAQERVFVIRSGGAICAKFIEAFADSTMHFIEGFNRSGKPSAVALMAAYYFAFVIQHDPVWCDGGEVF